MVRIKRFGVLQTAKFAAVLYFVFTAIFMIPVGLVFMMRLSVLGEGAAFPIAFGGVIMLVAPLVYAALGFLFVAVGCLIYNALAKVIGGIEIEIGE